MRRHVIETLEEFIEQGELWDRHATNQLVELLERETREVGDPLPAMLAKVFSAILLRTEMGPLDRKKAIEIEAHVYQRLYKVLEAFYDELPPAEARTRIEVFHRRLSRLLVEEDARPQSGGETGR